ncbi:GNAT family N-acetyltransferase [Actinoplanes regularis]|uniref:Ribosomal protein S18 acetylase RimI n=1 Tax=Actinoplanes regularis TaxID=52697 RepID=A0A238VZY1_9ACTN|nr:GNAT family N-acetyltransferase [Actinoplanes regularis]GIE91974.1 N-acetyltransferase [Actinoplanes regularis]GLW27572.1 N-acetyltransferase [Actinoplanes regularis]SNR39905.1 Ribosomal protein S18 acetylase RimI [Actinoplanes regularis]
MNPVPRPLTDDDWPGVLALETETYAGSGLSEDPAALASRAGRDTSFVLAADRRIVGYVLALSYPRFHFPDLSHPDTTAFASDNLHLHDLVVARGHRRVGLGTRLLHHLTAEARRQAYRLISLVAVGDGALFWSANGFRPHPGITPPVAYGPGAAYMSRPL